MKYITYAYCWLVICFFAALEIIHKTKPIFAEKFPITYFGADPTGHRNAKIAIQNAINYAKDGGQIIFPCCKYKIQ